MGEHRAAVKIEFSFHGKIYKQEWWINWFPTEVHGIDERIVKWFQECYEDGMDRYNYLAKETERKNEEKRLRERELEKLKRLKAKYDNPDELLP